MGRIHHEVSTAEKRIDSFIESLRREELREVDCARETDGLVPSLLLITFVYSTLTHSRFWIASLIAQMEHLAELHLEESLLDLAEREHSYINALDLDFDTIAAATGFTKQALATLTKEYPGSFSLPPCSSFDRSLNFRFQKMTPKERETRA